jgi:hypothetical protein
MNQGNDMRLIKDNLQGKNIAKKTDQYWLSEYEKELLDIIAEIIAGDLLKNLVPQKGEENVLHG